MLPGAGRPAGKAGEQSHLWALGDSGSTPGSKPGGGGSIPPGFAGPKRIRPVAVSRCRDRLVDGSGEHGPAAGAPSLRAPRRRRGREKGERWSDQSYERT